MIRIKLKKNQPQKNRKHLKNKARIRKKITGAAERPRFNIFRSQKHMYVQIIDDVSGKTLESYSSLKIKNGEKNKLDNAYKVGETIGKKALDKKIKEVVFDRGGFIYHGRVKAVAEGARKAGLKF
ncbi:MAG: 50S ribosomal protein L18 [Bdellovibrionales bacterium]